MEEVLEQPVEDMRLKNASVTEFVFEGGHRLDWNLCAPKTSRMFPQHSEPRTYIYIPILFQAAKTEAMVTHETLSTP